MASSAENPPHDHHHHHLPTTTAAPPPTPSSQLNLPSGGSTSSSDFLSHLLHRLPPSLSLSLPSRRTPSSSSAAVAPPLVSLSDTAPSLYSASGELGFFQLEDHRIPGHLPAAAESTARCLLDLPKDRKKSIFPANWPLGHDAGDDEEDGAAATESFCVDSACLAESSSAADLDLGPLREFIEEMERVGMEVVEKLASGAGFRCLDRENMCSLLWISDGGAANNETVRVYPYVVGLHYQTTRNQKQALLLSDSGWANVSGRSGSVLVTVGDIAQVWSNGKLKKVRGQPIPSLSDENNDDDSRCITMSLLITLPIESTVSPLIPNLVESDADEDDDDDHAEDNRTKRLFTSFSFEDYAWRVYHERLILKDPLVRYRV